MSGKDILTPAEVAEVLGLSLRTVKRHLLTGVIPGRKIGRVWRVRRVDLDRLLDPTARPPRPRSPARRPTRGKG